jgi:hypothetical protein
MDPDPAFHFDADPDPQQCIEQQFLILYFPQDSKSGSAEGM